LGACRTWSVESENWPQRGQFLPDLQPHSPAMGQKDGGKWTAAADLQPTISKSDRLLDGKPARLSASSVNGLAASLLIAFGGAALAPAAAQTSLPTLGDGGDLTASAERRAGDSIIRHLYRDPDYIDDPVLMEYVQTLWQAL